MHGIAMNAKTVSKATAGDMKLNVIKIKNRCDNCGAFCHCLRKFIRFIERLNEFGAWRNSPTSKPALKDSPPATKPPLALKGSPSATEPPLALRASLSATKPSLASNRSYASVVKMRSNPN